MRLLILGSVLSAGFILAVYPLAVFAADTAPAYEPPDGVTFAQADVVSEGVRLTAERFAPLTVEGPLPTLILCHGWGGVAAQLRDDGAVFAAAGYLVITFDYRGWGASDGRLIASGPLRRDAGAAHVSAEVKEVREVVDPLEQTTDLLTVIHWAAGDPQCDAARLGLWGTSFSGGHVVYAAARDARVRATYSQVPALDQRWAASVPAMGAEATARARGTLGYPEPGAVTVGSLKGAPILDKLARYAPVEDVAAVKRCAMLFVVAEKEELFDNRQHGILAHERAQGPKKLVTIPGITHYGIYGEAKAQAQQLALEWFDEHVKAAE